MSSESVPFTSAHDLDDLRRGLVQPPVELQLIVDALPALVALVDTDGRYVFANETHERWFGLPRDALRGRRVADVLDPALFEEVRPHLSAALAGARVELETSIPRKDGPSRPVEATYVPRFGPSGRVIGVLVFVIDITQRARARRRADVLQHLTSGLAAARTAADVARVTMDPFLDALGASAGTFFVPVPGTDDLELVGERGRSPEPVAPLRRPRADVDAVTARAVIERRPVYVDDLEAEQRSLSERSERQAAGERRDVRRAAAVPMIAGGTLFGVVAAGFREPGPFTAEERGFIEAFADHCAEALDRVRLEEQQRRAFDDLRAQAAEHARLFEAERTAGEQAERASRQLAAEAQLRDRFLSVVGHDLRNPLSAISLAAALLHKKNAVEPQRRQVLQRIISSANRMQRMLEQILDFARIRNAGGLTLDPQPADLRTVVEEILEETRTAHPESVVRFDASGDAAGSWDVDRLGEVVSNLVANAVKHGNGEPVSVRLRGAEDEVVLEVHNQGPPIPEDVLPVLFEPFRRGPGGADKTSLGLGLYITREIVIASGGDIDVTSTPEGTVFAVRLPRRSPSGAPVLSTLDSAGDH